MQAGACAPGRGSYACFDDVRTISLIREIAAPTTDVQAIPVYVVGMVDPSSSDTELQRVLNEMADAGGRPSGSMTARYYSVRNLADVASAFERIVRGVNGCTFFARPVPADLDDVSIRVGDFTVPRDRARGEGWDWTDSPVGELTLFGGACMLASAGRPVSISVGCTRDRLRLSRRALDRLDALVLLQRRRSEEQHAIGDGEPLADLHVAAQIAAHRDAHAVRSPFGVHREHAEPVSVAHEAAGRNHHRARSATNVEAHAHVGP